MGNIIDFKDIVKEEKLDEKLDEYMAGGGLTADNPASFYLKKAFGKNFHIVAVPQAGSEQAIRNFQNNVMRKILEDSKDWFFMLDNLYVLSNIESFYFDRFSREFGIKKVDPFVKPYDKKVAKNIGVNLIESIFSLKLCKLPDDVSDVAMALSLGENDGFNEYRKMEDDIYLHYENQPQLYMGELSYFEELADLIMKASKAMAHKNIEKTIKHHTEKNVFVETPDYLVDIFDDNYQRDFYVPKKFRKESQSLDNLRYEHFVEQGDVLTQMYALELAEKMDDPLKITLARKKLERSYFSGQ